MYTSNDVMVGCMLGALSLPHELQGQLIACMLPNVHTLTLSTEAMPPTYRSYLAQAFAHLCEKAVGLLLQQQATSSSLSASPITPLDPFLSIIFTPTLPPSSDPTYLAKRL